MPQVVIKSQTRVPSIAPGRHGMLDRVVFFDVVGGGPDFVTLPDEDFTLEKAQAAIAEHLRTRVKVEGHTFDV